MNNKEVKDFVGQKFGHLTLLSDEKEKDKNGKGVYSCMCDCGNTTYRTLYGLISGHDKTCGKCILRYADRTGKVKDITNQRFGSLVAIHAYGNDNYGRKTWLFKCDCGNEIVCSENNVATGNTKSCGCLKHRPSTKRKDLTGERFGRLVVVGLSKKTKDGSTTWDCLCDCGNHCVVRTSSLTRGKTKSCGCILEEIQVKSNMSNVWAMTNKKIFDYECAYCGSKEHLHSHHIFPRNKYPQYVNSALNGITLCSRCHKSFHKKYGYDCDAYDLAEFLKLPRVCGDIFTLVITHNCKEDLEKAKDFIDMLINSEYGEKEK